MEVGERVGVKKYGVNGLIHENLTKIMVSYYLRALRIIVQPSTTIPFV
jgi:hypothetical protein